MYSHLTTAERAYIAGLIDGEGCIRGRHWTVRGAGVPSTSVEMVVSMTHAQTINWLAERIGATVSCQNRFPKRNCYSTKVTGKRAGELLKVIMPYLVTKKEEAAVAVAIADTIGVFASKGRGRKSIPEDVRRFRYAAVERLHLLKQPSPLLT